MVTKAEINLVRSLSSKKGREDSGLFVVEGRKMVCEAIMSDFGIEKIYSCDQAFDNPLAITVSEKEMERMSNLKTHQQILALIRKPCVQNLEMINEGLTLVLDGVQDPGNLGTIIRIADWFGINSIFCSNATADCYNPKVVQATMGSLFRVEVQYCDLTEFLKNHQASQIKVYGTFLEGENIYNAELNNISKGVIVMGSEGKGISAEVSEFIDRKLFIPPFPENSNTAESLNVGVATALICSEFRRRALF